MLWRGWGDPARAAPLPDDVRTLLRDLLGAGSGAEAAAAASAAPEPDLHEVAVPPSRLSPTALAALAAAVGDDAVRDDAETRIRHTRGKSTPDLLRIRRGDASGAPDAVVLPGSPDAVLAVLATCTEHRIAVVPFGGGTSVVGGLAPAVPGGPAGDRLPRAVIALDLRRLDRLVALDPVSRTATLEAGLRAPAAEALLRERGFTLGHFPQSYEWATIGGFAATRSSGQASAGYGRFDDMVMGIAVATPRGPLELGRAPRSAAGPDLRQLILGSEGAFGVITAVTVLVRPAPELATYEGWRFPSFAAGTAALRALAQDGPLPTVLRLSDETETLAGAAPPAGGGCLAVTGYEGTAADVAARRTAAGAVLGAAGGTPLGPEPGERWARERYAAPYLRDALLDAGFFAETLETATFWAGLPRLYDAVRSALTTTLAGAGTPPLVLCHISHVYPAGAALYFTVVAADPGPAGWAAAKRAAGEAILGAGGTISHHHGVGTDHLDWYAEEIGPLGAEVLRAVKDRLDPAGILNPGVLVSPTQESAR
ncbi:MAG TPA: FAD-binding oxidoreductase [Streptosporangiaceae bacterium]